MRSNKSNDGIRGSQRKLENGTRRHARCTGAGRTAIRSNGGELMAEQATKSITVGASVGEVFEAWSNFENFPHFMKNIKTVEKRPDGTTHWVMDGPLGKTVQWDAETTM